MHEQDIALVDMPSLAFGAHRRKSSSLHAGARSAPAKAQHCLLKRAGGILSVLDMDQGAAACPAHQLLASPMTGSIKCPLFYNPQKGEASWSPCISVS